MKKILIISPHYDDAIGSCAGKILQDNFDCHHSILTVFSKPHGICLSPFVLHLHNDVWHTVNAWETRNRENNEACRLVQAASMETPYLEAIYRTDAVGNWLYPCDGDIFRDMVAEDLVLKEKINRYLTSIVNTYDKVIFPAGRGKHVDHLILMEVGLSLYNKYQNIMFYNDFSYEEEECVLPDNWKSIKYYITPEIQAKKERAIAKYHSQVNMLFGSEENIHKHYSKYNKDEKGFFEVYYEKKSNKN